MTPIEASRLMAELRDLIDEVVYLYGEPDRDEMEQAANDWDREELEHDRQEPHVG